MTHGIGSDGLERRLARALDTARAAGAVASLVLGDRERILVHGEASPGRSMTAATPIHVCSCSKTFTAAVFAALVQDGLVDWDHPVQEVVPEFRLPGAQAGDRCSFRDLASMRTGLARDGIAEWGIRQDLPREIRLARAAAMDLAAPFRDRFTYSNLCYIALALAAERLAGCPYSQLVQALCAPLAMADTLSVGPGPVPAHAASPHMPLDGRLRPVRELTGANSEGSARIHLSGRDAVRWMRFLLEALAGSDAGPLRAKTVAAMTVPQIRVHAPDRRIAPDPQTDCHYGLGFHITRLRGQRLLRHGGGGRGWRHALALAPEARAGVMLMASAEHPSIEGIALDLLDVLLGEADADWGTQFSTAAQAAAQAGRSAIQDRFPAGTASPASPPAGHYHNAATGLVRIELHPDGARFTPEDAPDLSARLRPLGAETFALEFEEPAMAHQPLDPPFRLRFDAGGIETTYFGRLQRQAP